MTGDKQRATMSDSGLLPFSIYQHFYGRIGTGFDTLWISPEIVSIKDRIVKYSKSYPMDYVRNRPYKPSIRYAFPLDNHYMVGSNTFRLEGGRDNASGHQFLFLISKDDILTDVSHFAGDFPFLENFSDNQTIELETPQILSQGNWVMPNLPAYISEEVFKQLILDVMTELDKSEDRKYIYLSFPVPEEEQQEVTLRLVKAIVSNLPFSMRQLLGYTSYFIGERGSDIEGASILLRVVPKDRIERRGAAHYLNNRPINSHIIYDFSKNIFHNQSSIKYDFLDQLNGDTSQFYERFEELLTDEMISKYGYVGSLDSFWQFNDLAKVVREIDDQSSRVDFLLDLLGWIATCPTKYQTNLYEEIVSVYLDQLGKQNFVNRQLIERFAQLNQEGLTMKLLEKGLETAEKMGDKNELISLIVATEGQQLIYKQLIEEVVKKNVAYLDVYSRYRLSATTTVISLFEEIEKLIVELGEDNVLPIVTTIFKERKSDFELTDCNSLLRDKVKVGNLVSVYQSFVSNLFAGKNQENLLQLTFSELKMIDIEEQYFKGTKSGKLLDIIQFLKENCKLFEDSTNVVTLAGNFNRLPQKKALIFADYLKNQQSFAQGRDLYKLELAEIFLSSEDRDSLSLCKQLLSQHTGSRSDYHQVLKWLLEVIQENWSEFLMQNYPEKFLTSLADGEELLKYLSSMLSKEQVRFLRYGLTYRLEQAGQLSFIERQKLRLSKKYQTFKKSYNLTIDGTSIDFDEEMIERSLDETGPKRHSDRFRFRRRK